MLIVKRDHPVTRHEVLEHNRRWTAYDQKVIEEQLDRLEVDEHHLQACKKDINWFSKGVWVAWLTHGRIVFRPGYEPEDSTAMLAWRDDHHYIALSTSVIQPEGKQQHPKEDAPAVCPSCFTALPKTGQCDYCD